jgi:hypothetical protein
VPAGAERLEAIVTAIGGAATIIAAAIRWSVGRLAKAQDRATEALVKNAESNGPRGQVRRARRSRR